MLRAMGGLTAVLALLAGALWLIRRYEMNLPGGAGRRRAPRVAITDRVGIDAKRTLVLVRRDGTDHLLLLSPHGDLIVDSADAADPPLAIDLAQCRALEIAGVAPHFPRADPIPVRKK